MYRASCLTIRMLALILLAMNGGCGQAENKKENTEVTVEKNDKYFLKRHVSPESAKKIEAFCGDCHKMPIAENFPIDGWKKEVERGFDFYAQSGRTDLTRPNVFDTIAYFTQKAPSLEEFLNEVSEIPSDKQRRVDFKEVEYKPNRNQSGVANVEFVAETRSIISTDMRDGNVYELPLANPGQSHSIQNAEAPINTTVCDLDQDGKHDLLIADIGEYKATDATRGKLIWMRHEDGEYFSKEIAGNLGRICQTVVADFDGDEDLDILVAEFGYFKTGSIFLLKNNGLNGAQRAFEKVEVDGRHGTVRMQAVDIDGDGDQDFLAAIAQEHETVVLFVNDGSGQFSSRSIFSADFPSYGTSGIEVVDLDGDGDVDVLYTNGDTFDSLMPKKYHSIQWLENDGNLNFTRHEIGRMPGVHRARAGDFDADGDLDIVACAFMSNNESEISFDSILYLENKGKMKFEKFWIEKGTLHYPNLTVGDFDQDGKLDFAVGTAVLGKPTPQAKPVRIFMNQFQSVNKP